MIYHILIVDDDERLQQLLSCYLQEYHYKVTTASTVNQAAFYLDMCLFDLMILDIMLPHDEEGITFLKKIKAQTCEKFSAPPVLMLTARKSDKDKIEALEHGADDYLGKPFNPYELILRIRAIMRRIAKQKKWLPSEEVVYFGPFCYDLNKHLLKREDHIVPLTHLESQLLHKLVCSQDHIIERTTLTTMSARALDVQMSRLRQKLGEDPKKPLYLQTLRNKGYILRL